MTIEARLAEMGLELPEAAAPVASYVPTMEVGGLIHVSGQLPFVGGKLVTGKLGDAVTLEQGQEAARAAGLMVLAQVKKALGGDLSRLRRIVKLGVFVASDPEFTDQPKVANGASDLMQAVLGDAGKHARSAVGVAVLPLDAAVEVEALVEIA